ncbi:MAG: dihydroneopterin aldolase [Elusimicrobia bacterium CG11_big_fil_rev_8_21_14_0_20_64_6]|nr:MAG: dihydroneopterin aldolase [Elusimicrobia bacterium CG11_big_fil_rev_8_21_14_0_20_64_6]
MPVSLTPPSNAPTLLDYPAMSDMIWLNGVECRCKVGVPSSERSRRQKILVDAGLEVDIRPAAARDDFRRAADYWAVEKLIRAEAETGERALVETLAEKLAAAILRSQPLVSAVTVRVRKTPAVMPKTREVVVEIRRTR